MIATATDPAAATTVEDHPSETLARRLRAHLQALATLRLPITLYVGGQFTGGCDIVREMNTSGEIQAIIRANHNTAT
jgi:glutaredoxin-related protein